MSDLLHRTPSVGRVTKKLMAINPELDVQDIIHIIRQSILTQGQAHLAAGEFLTAEIIDEAKAEALAQATLHQQSIC
jgi:hypothetical protein